MRLHHAAIAMPDRSDDTSAARRCGWLSRCAQNYVVKYRHSIGKANL